MTKDKYFKYYNPNPEGHEDACDCVVRALCAATGLSWYEVYDKCCEIGKEHGVMDECYSLGGRFKRPHHFAVKSLVF